MTNRWETILREQIKRHTAKEMMHRTQQEAPRRRTLPVFEVRRKTESSAFARLLRQYGLQN